MGKLCIAYNASNNPCSNRAGKGDDRCWMHTTMTRNVGPQNTARNMGPSHIPTCVPNPNRKREEFRGRLGRPYVFENPIARDDQKVEMVCTQRLHCNVVPK